MQPETEKSANQPAQKRATGSVRTCIGCREAGPPEGLVRLVAAPDGTIVADLGGKSFGRGAWIHPREDCLRRAPKALGKALHAPVAVDAAELASAIRTAAERRIRGLMAGAAGGKKLVLGANAVKDELEAGRVALLVIATDARAAVESREIEAAIKKGLAVAWGTKAELGELCHRQDLGVVGVLDAGIARALRGAVQSARTPECRAFAEEG